MAALFDHVGANIRQHRQALGLTQQQVADAVSVQKNTISEIERGREPSLSVLMEIAKALGVSAAALLEGPVASYSPAADTGSAVLDRPVLDTVLKSALAQTEANLVRLSEISGYAKGVLEMMRAVTAGQEKVVASLVPWVRHEEQIYDTDPQLLEDAAQDVMRDAERVAQEQTSGSPKRKRKTAG